MKAIKILNEIKEQYENNVSIAYNKAYYSRMCKALLELEYLAYKNSTVGEVLNNRKISYTIIDDKEFNND